MLEPAQTVALFQKAPALKTYAAGDTIFEDGEYGDVMFGLIEGEVELFVRGKVVETIHKGDVFGEGASVAMLQNPLCVYVAPRCPQRVQAMRTGYRAATPASGPLDVPGTCANK